MEKMCIHLREGLLSGFWLIQNALFGEWWPGARSLPSPTHNLLFLFQMVDKVLPIWGLAVHVTTCLLTKLTLTLPTGQNPLCPPLTVHKPSVQDCVLFRQLCSLSLSSLSRERYWVLTFVWIHSQWREGGIVLLCNRHQQHLRRRQAEQTVE